MGGGGLGTQGRGKTKDRPVGVLRDGERTGVVGNYSDLTTRS